MFDVDIEQDLKIDLKHLTLNHIIELALLWIKKIKRQFNDLKKYILSTSTWILL